LIPWQPSVPKAIGSIGKGANSILNKLRIR